MQIIRIVTSAFWLSALLLGCGDSSGSAVPTELQSVVESKPSVCIVVRGSIGNLATFTRNADGTENSGFLTVPLGDGWEHDLAEGVEEFAISRDSIAVSCTKDANVEALVPMARNDIEKLAGPVRMWVKGRSGWREEIGLTFASPPPTRPGPGNTPKIE